MGVHPNFSPHEIEWMRNFDADAEIERLRNYKTADERKAIPDAELRPEMIAAMTATGIAPHVAADRTNTVAKLLTEGRAFGIV